MCLQLGGGVERVCRAEGKGTDWEADWRGCPVATCLVKGKEMNAGKWLPAFVHAFHASEKMCFLFTCGTLFLMPSLEVLPSWNVLSLKQTAIFSSWEKM